MTKFHTSFHINRDIKLIFETSNPIQKLEPYHFQGVVLRAYKTTTVLQHFSQTDPPIEKLSSILSCVLEDMQKNNNQSLGRTLKEQCYWKGKDYMMFFNPNTLGACLYYLNNNIYFEVRSLYSQRTEKKMSEKQFSNVYESMLLVQMKVNTIQRWQSRLIVIINKMYENYARSAQF